MLAVKHRLQLYIQSQSADAAPPLGTVLGNVGVNTVAFCKEFNAATANLPPFYTIPVRVEVYSNRTYRFEIFRPTLNSIIRLLAKPLATPKGKKGIYRCLRLREAVLLARWQFPALELRKSLPVVFGALASGRIYVK
jgi:large subunit ribosomal protein L11